MIKMFENFRTGYYLFNNEIVEYVDDMQWSDQIKVLYRHLNGKTDSVLLDNESEFDDYFTPYNYNKVSDKPKEDIYKIVYSVGNKIIETIKDNLKKEDNPYGLANYLNKDPKYRIGKVKVMKK